MYVPSTVWFILKVLIYTPLTTRHQTNKVTEGMMFANCILAKFTHAYERLSCLYVIRSG